MSTIALSNASLSVEFERPSITTLIFTATAIYLMMGLGAFCGWRVTGNAGCLTNFVTYHGAALMIGLGAIEFWLALIALQQFLQDEPLRPAWFMIALAALCQVIGSIFAQVLGVNSLINPLVYLPVGWTEEMGQGIHAFGLLLSGPVQMALLAWGLFYVLRVYRRFGMMVRLSPLDWILFAVVGAYAVMEVGQSLVSIASGTPVTLSRLAAWASDPLLLILLLEAMFLRRSVAIMGWGLVGKCWSAFTLGIFFTALGEVGIWASANGYLAGPESAIIWYIWFLAAGAYALGPAYQVQATQKAGVTIDLFDF